MQPEIAIVDYQMGNLQRSSAGVRGLPGLVTSDPDRIGQAAKVILPGVGGFGDAIRELRYAI